MAENLYTPKSIRTRTGQYVNVFNPDPATIKIFDIAHALSQQCRFGGHLPGMYTVAQHCVLCAGLVEEKYKFDALMHDASEAYLVDFPRPLKEEIPAYKTIEDKLMQVLAKKYGFSYPLPEAVKTADKQMLKTEWNQLMIKNEHCTIDIQSPEDARTSFLSHYQKLKP